VVPAQLIEDGRVFQGGDVLCDLFAARHRLQQTAHDLARAGLGKIVGEADIVGLGDGADLRGDPVAQLLHQRVGLAGGPLTAAHDEGEHRFTLDLVRLADDGGFGHPRVRHQRRLDLHRAQAMPGNVQDVVDAPHDPEIPVLVAVSAVAGDVVAVIELRPVGIDVAAVVAPDGP